MKRLYLHIGTHRTGTTSFQRFLVDHRRRLLEAGLAIVTEVHPNGRTVGNCEQFANAILRRSLMTFVRMRGVLDPPGLGDTVSHAGALRIALDQPPTERVLLSAEALCFARTRAELLRLRALLRWCGSPEVVPVLAVRDAEEWRASWMGQLTKLGDEVVRPPGSGTDNVVEDWYFELDAIHSFWSAFGPVRTVDYDTAVAEHGSVIPALLEAVDARDVSNPDDYWLNERPTGPR